MEDWKITTEQAEIACKFLSARVQEGDLYPSEIEAVRAVHAALYWADRIEIED